MKKILTTAALCLAIVPPAAFSADIAAFTAKVPDADKAKIRKALPATAPAKVKAPRKLLVCTLTKGFRHKSIATGVYALDELGKKTGAFTITHTENPADFAADNLAKYDGVVMLNTTGTLFKDPALRKGFVDYIKSGKAIVGIHSATDTFADWAEYGLMMGGYFHGHPWNAHSKIRLKMEDPDHPTLKAFGGKSYDTQDEIYQYKDTPYSRERLRILYSLDPSGTDMTSPGMKKKMRRKDGDYPVGWVQQYGKGRLFYSNLGHNNQTYWDPTILQHFLAGIQFACGDLEGATAPSGPLKK